MSEMDPALRVLMAITNNFDPEPRDVEELRRFAPECSDLPADELACVIVRRAIKRRAARVGQ